MVVGGGLHLVLSRPRPEDVPVVVATRLLPVGAALGPGDTELRHLPPDALPVGSLTTVPPEPAHLAVPLQQGEVVTGGDLRTSGLLEGVDDTVAVFVPLTDVAVAEAAGAGDEVDVHSSVDGAVVARRALVLQARTGEQPGLWLAVEEGTAARLAAARGADPLGAAMLVALHPGPGDR